MGGLEKGLILTFRRLLDPPFRPLLLRAGMLLYVVLCCVVLCIGAGYVYAVRGWKPQFRLQILRSKIKGMGLWRKHQIMFECVCVCLLMLSTVQYCSAGSPLQYDTALETWCALEMSTACHGDGVTAQQQ